MNRDPKISFEINSLFFQLTPHISNAEVQSLSSWNFYMSWVLERDKATLGTDVKIPMIISNLKSIGFFEHEMFL